MTDATPEGQHMSDETIVQVGRFLEKIRHPLVLLSGGEPTEHPDVLAIIEAFMEHGFVVGLLTNGLFFEEKPELAAEITQLPVMIQVTYDPRYYPRKPKVPELAQVVVTALEEDEQLFPAGRALTNGLECGRSYPRCFNLRSIVRHTHSLPGAMDFLASRNKFCTPSINIDGTIVAGECPTCHAIGTVSTPLDMLTHNIERMTCDTCGLVKNLTQEQKLAIGEARILLR
jgi:hypothetical protein